MSRNRGLVSLLGVVALSSAGIGCNKGGGGGGTGKLDGTASSALDFVPKNSIGVAGANWSKFKETKLFALVQSSIPAEAKTELDEIKSVCSIDLLNDLDSVVGGGSDLDHMVIVVKGKWDEEKVSKCATAMGEKKGKKIAVAKDGNITTYTPEGKHAAHIGWAGDLAIVTKDSLEKGDKTALVEVMKKASSVKDNKEFMDLLGKADSSATIYGAFVPVAGSDAASTLGKATGGTEKPTGLYGTLALTKSLDINAGLRFASGADAKAVAERGTKELEGAKQGNPQAAEFLKNASITAADNDAVFKVSLDEKQLDQLTEMMKQMLPMLPMMMGQ